MSQRERAVRAGRLRGAAACVTMILVSLVAVAAEPPSVERLLAAHLEARGGAERWKAIDSMKIEGRWTAFSEEGPMTILRKRPGLYRFDHVLFGAPATLAYDGKTPWMRSAVFEAPDGKAIDEPWRRNVVEDARFGSPLLDLAAHGATIERVGRDTVDGQAVWVLRVRAGDAPEETWYLDAATWLERKRVSRTFDVFSGGIEIPMETYYMDFREVGGVRLPFREERHFGTRYHVFEIDRVEIDPDVDEADFRLPAAEPAEAP